MNLPDMVILAFSNLWRTKLRTLLTTLGVIIGIGALTSMVSFGTGMQKNITDTFTNNDLFTSITVTSKKVNLDEITSGNVSEMAEALNKESTPLTDSILSAIRELNGVELAYPNLEFPARLNFLGDSSSTRLQALPAGIQKYKPFTELLAGSFFDNDSSNVIVLREEVLKKLNIRLYREDKKIELSKQDSAKGVKLMHADSIIGKTIEIVSLSLNPSKVPNAIFSMLRDKPEMPFDETISKLEIIGILKRAGQFGANMFSGGAIIPTGTAKKIPKLEFSSVWDILDNKNQKGTYSSIHVRLKDMKKMDEVKASLDAMDVGTFSIADQLDEIRRAFLIFDSILGAIGAIALIVAGLGIINTMVMTILERTREIGIMKAIGGSEKEIKMIFFVEAAVIGFVGAIFGLLLGWLVTRVANAVMNAQILPEGVDPVNLFYFPVWLILGAIAFSILISLAAAMYPASRAARIDPVRALRHD
jgi:putative ABC transport system permease protein